MGFNNLCGLQYLWVLSNILDMTVLMANGSYRQGPVRLLVQRFLDRHHSYKAYIKSNDFQTRIS